LVNAGSPRRSLKGYLVIFSFKDKTSSGSLDTNLLGQLSVALVHLFLLFTFLALDTNQLMKLVIILTKKSAHRGQGRIPSITWPKGFASLPSICSLIEIGEAQRKKMRKEIIIVLFLFDQK
jgi:hypothetical protein